MMPDAPDPITAMIGSTKMKRNVAPSARRITPKPIRLAVTGRDAGAAAATDSDAELPAGANVFVESALAAALARPSANPLNASGEYARPTEK